MIVRSARYMYMYPFNNVRIRLFVHFYPHRNVRFPDRRWRCDVSDVQQGGAGARPRGLTPVILYKYVLNMGVGRLISVLVN